MENKEFEDFKKKVSNHFYKEARLAETILSELSEEQAGEITELARNHPWAKFLREFKALRK